MNLKKLLVAVMAFAVTAMTVNFADISVASAEEAVESETQVEQTVPKNTYRYTSQRYGYSINTPMKPLGVIPASTVYENSKGEVLVFENEGFNLKKAWIIMPNAFLPEDIPDNLINLSDAERQTAVENFGKKGLFEQVNIVEMEDGKAGMYCVSAKEVEVDTTGDGVADRIMEAENQAILTYFKGDFGGCFVVELLQNPVMTPEAQMEYQQGLLTFHQWPTTFDPDAPAVPENNK